MRLSSREFKLPAAERQRCFRDWKIRAVLATLLVSGYSAVAETTLIAPMIAGMRGCASAYEKTAITDGEAAFEHCLREQESAASLIDAKLDKLGPAESADGRFALGYTLPMSLLSYLDFQGDLITVDRERVRHDLRVIGQSERKLVLYLFANHFAGRFQLNVARKLAEDPRNLMRLANGTAPLDRYFLSSIYPWSLADENSSYDKARRLAASAVLDEVCKLPRTEIDKIQAVTVLGEVHHFFPNFMNGMGYSTGDYQITNYSSRSIAQFQHWLKEKYGNLTEFNAQLSSQFKTFSDVLPPSKNIKREPLQHFFEHIDAHAHGEIPFFGWAFDQQANDFNIHIFLNGDFLAAAKSGLTRLDVAQAIEGLEDSNVGYRHKLDYRNLPTGIHHVDVRYVSETASVSLATYELAVMDRQQSRPTRLRQHSRAVDRGNIPDSFRYWADYPPPSPAVFYNPLARLWLEFRSWQVTSDIERYAKLVKDSCLDDERVFSHQIGAGFKASWDPVLLASEASLEPNSHYNLGINLYGGIIHGNYFFNWLAENGHVRYGIPEMHPMTAQDPALLVSALRRHHRHGAVFMSPYFLSVQPARFGSDPEHDRFKIEPTNTEYGSNQLYKALQLLMNTPAQTH